MRRTFLSAAFRALPKTSLFHRSAPSVTAATVPLVAATQLRLASFSALADATRRELEDEQQRATKEEKPKLPAGWTLDRKPGEGVFTMRKTFEDEEILLRYRGETAAKDIGETKHEFSVFVTCKGKTLVFDMSFEGGEVVLERIGFLPDSKLALDDSAEAGARRALLYSGPDVNELDSGLVDAFVGYLEARGVDDELGEFLEAYGVWAEQAEYETWLSAVHQFVA